MATPLSLANVQGDVLIGLSKQTQLFFFFHIQQADSFRSRLSNLLPLITTSEQARGDRNNIKDFKAQSRVKVNTGDGETPHPGPLPVNGVNVAFSAEGIKKLGITENIDEINDETFIKGMQADAKDLGDNGADDASCNFHPDWDAAFLQEIHGVILVTGECRHTIHQKLEEVKSILGAADDPCIKEIKTLVGDVRPGDQRGHEHFGYRDGISQPAVEGVHTPLPGQKTVEQGVILLGRGSDQSKNRPTWALDGSFLAFRKLPQLVPEFDKFLLENAKPVLDPTAPVVDILGARFVGRWKSGAPITETLTKDDPELGSDPQRNNDFKFQKHSQDACPFAAHIRKMVPREDLLDKEIIPHMILRRGIPFGPEVTPEEKQANTTQHERGLYFVCYQSNLSEGFHFLQKDWANRTDFPPQKIYEQPGHDPIIGQQNTGGIRMMTGGFSDGTAQTLDLTAQWVNSKGGEYFFSPSLPALRDTFSKAS